MNEEINSLPSLDNYEEWDKIEENSSIWRTVVYNLLLPPNFITRYKNILLKFKNDVCLFQKYPEYLFKDNIIPNIEACLENSKVNPIYNIKEINGWFISYILESWIKLNIKNRVKLFSYYHLNYNRSTYLHSDKILKVRVYWKDVIFPYYVDIDKVDIIRTYNIDDNFQKR